MDAILQAIDNELYPFNDYLLKDFRKEQINKAPDFMGIIFSEAIKLFKGEIKYLGYKILSAEERVAYELDNKITGGMVNIRDSEWILVSYEFEYRNQIYKVPIYLPYLHNNFIVINNTKYAIQLAISEKVFTKITDGLTAKVVRSPINFWRNRYYQMNSISSGEQTFSPIVTIKIHNKSRKRRSAKRAFPTVIHYLLCKYGLVRTMEIFSISRDDMAIVNACDKKDVGDYEFYEARKSPKNKSPLYMKVNKNILTDLRKKKVVASILYLLNHFRKHSIEDLYDPDGTVYKVMLGKIIYGNHINDAMALNHIDSHMSSLDSYLDPITQARLQAMGIQMNNIYDLFIYVFCNIDQMLITNSHSDLYDKRIDVLDSLLVATIVKSIYYRFYNFESRSNKCNEKLVKSLLRISSQQIKRIYQSPIVRMNPSRYNDNWLISIGSKKVRLNSIKSANGANIIGAPEHRFHPSFASVESLIAFSSSNPGSAGTINPFQEIDEHGFIIKNEDYAKKADAILPYLPHK